MEEGGASESILDAKFLGEGSIEFKFLPARGRWGSSSVGSNSILHNNPWGEGGGVQLNPTCQVLGEGSIKFKFLLERGSPGQQQCRIKCDPTPRPVGEGGGASNSILHACGSRRVAGCGWPSTLEDEGPHSSSSWMNVLGVYKVLKLTNMNPN